MPSDEPVNSEMEIVGTLVRTESADLVCAYKFDLQTNEMITERRPNPNGGREHKFTAYRLKGDPMDAVSLRDPRAVIDELEQTAAGLDGDAG